jgi:hypothetical protein
LLLSSAKAGAAANRTANTSSAAGVKNFIGVSLFGGRLARADPPG